MSYIYNYYIGGRGLLTMSDSYRLQNNIIADLLFDLRGLLQMKEEFDEDDLEKLTEMAEKYEDRGVTVWQDPGESDSELDNWNT